MPVLQSARSRCARASRGTDPTIMSGAFERSCACDADRLEVISPYEIGASTQTASASTFFAGTSPMKPGLSLWLQARASYFYVPSAPRILGLASRALCWPSR